jgi:hypothetical protein
VQAMRQEGQLYLSSAASPIRSPMSPPGQPVPTHIQRAKQLLSRRDGGSPAEWDQLVVIRVCRYPLSQEVCVGLRRSSKRRWSMHRNSSPDSGRQVPADEIYRFPLQVDDIPPGSAAAGRRSQSVAVRCAGHG